MFICAVLPKDPIRGLSAPRVVAAAAVPYGPVYRARKQAQIWIRASLAGARSAPSVCVSCDASHESMFV